MKEPIEGWKTLIDLLKPGGLLRIGLYSRRARKHITRIRRHLMTRFNGIDEESIRVCREELKQLKTKDANLISTASDFHSLSAIRDLLFHVQEHTFSLPQIKGMLSELNLTFCGFENPDATASFFGYYGSGQSSFRSQPLARV